MCSEGYASTLAAATLRRIGLREATDLDGGFQAWKAAGLPTRRPSRPADACRRRKARPEPEPSALTDDPG
jgi:3-mercaptopyruvate sulfurtransferase SseA